MSLLLLPYLFNSSNQQVSTRPLLANVAQNDAQTIYHQCIEVLIKTASQHLQHHTVHKYQSSLHYCHTMMSFIDEADIALLSHTYRLTGIMRVTPKSSLSLSNEHEHSSLAVPYTHMLQVNVNLHNPSDSLTKNCSCVNSITGYTWGSLSSSGSIR